MRSIYIITSFFFLSLLLYACDDNEYVKADRLFRQGEYAKAVDLYDQYLKYQPKHFESYYNRGRAYEELGEYEKAAESYQQALEISPEDANALLSIGKYHYRNENYKDAAHFFERAAEKGNTANAHYLQARSLHKAGITDEALEAYNNAISIDGDLGKAYLYRGALKVHLGRESAGCSDFRLAQSLDVAEASDALKSYCQ